MRARIWDRWILLVIRDIMFKRKQYFRDFRTFPVKIASYILSDRLKKLEGSEIVLRQRDPANARRVLYAYRKGFDLVPTILELLCWGAKHDAAGDVDESLVQRFE